MAIGNHPNLDSETDDPRQQAMREMMEEIENRFTYHQPIGNQAERYAVIRDNAKAFALMLCSVCPPSREQALALTHLDEVVMFANASIARREREQPLIEVPQ